MSTQRILCGRCRADLTGPADYNNDSIFKCPTCGEAEKYGEIVKEAHAYFADVVKARLDKQLEGLAGTSSRFIKVTVTKFDPPKRQYRFILDEVPE
jgi:hypothetical protein